MEASGDDRIEKIRQVIASYPEGISFNKLHRKTEKVCARQTLANKLKVLVDAGLVEKTRVGKQRTVYRDTELAKGLADIAVSIKKITELLKTDIMFQKYLRNRGYIDPAEAVKCIVRHLHTFVYDTCMIAVAWSLEFKGHAKELIATEMLDACYTALEECLIIISNDSELKSAFKKKGSEAFSWYSERIKNMSKNLIEFKKEIDGMEDLELKSRLKALFKM